MESKEARKLRNAVALLRITLGIILLVTWWENLQKGLYQADGFAGFITWLAEGHPIEPYRAFLINVMAANAAIFGAFQLRRILLFSESICFVFKSQHRRMDLDVCFAHGGSLGSFCGAGGARLWHRPPVS